VPGKWPVAHGLRKNVAGGTQGPPGRAKGVGQVAGVSCGCQRDANGQVNLGRGPPGTQEGTQGDTESGGPRGRGRGRGPDQGQGRARPGRAEVAEEGGRDGNPVRYICRTGWRSAWEPAASPSRG